MKYDLIKLLKESAEVNVAPSDELDKKIMDVIYTSEDRIYFKWHHVLKPAFVAVLLLFAVLILRNLFYPDYVYNNIMSTIIEVQKMRDINKALDLYSNEFFKTSSKNRLKNNIQILFKYYKEIHYVPEKYRVVLKGNNLLIENRIYYEAQPVKSGLPPIVYKGKERIYLKKENNKWKIVAWIYDS